MAETGKVNNEKAVADIGRKHFEDEQDERGHSQVQPVGHHMLLPAHLTLAETAPRGINNCMAFPTETSQSRNSATEIERITKTAPLKSKWVSSL